MLTFEGGITFEGGFSLTITTETLPNPYTSNYSFTSGTRTQGGETVNIYPDITVSVLNGATWGIVP